jgi:hypothetical protein
VPGGGIHFAPRSFLISFASPATIAFVGIARPLIILSSSIGSTASFAQTLWTFVSHVTLQGREFESQTSTRFCTIPGAFHNWIRSALNS